MTIPMWSSVVLLGIGVIAGVFIGAKLMLYDMTWTCINCGSDEIPVGQEKCPYCGADRKENK